MCCSTVSPLAHYRNQPPPPPPPQKKKKTPPILCLAIIIYNGTSLVRIVWDQRVFRLVARIIVKSYEGLCISENQNIPTKTDNDDRMYVCNITPWLTPQVFCVPEHAEQASSRGVLGGGGGGGGATGLLKEGEQQASWFSN